MIFKVGLLVLGTFFSLLIGATGVEAANGTATGTILGPQGEKSSKTTYTFKNLTTGASITGQTTDTGTFSQTLDSTANFSFTANFDSSVSGFEYAEPITIPYLRVPSGGTMSMGEIRAFYKVLEADKDLDEGPLPSQCTASISNGAPIISRVGFVDEARGAFMYAGRNVGVKIFADKTGHTVSADFSVVEGNQPGTNVVAATDNGDGTYTANRTLVNTSMGGGLVIVSATNGSGTTTACSASGPTNLDIRTATPPGSTDSKPLFTGAETTDFSKVADFRAMENFTMHIDGVVKVVFKKKINMLDKTTQSFMKNLAKKIAKDKGKFSLDAKAAIQLKKDANAEITMYNVPYLSKPDIKVDGAFITDTDAKNIVFDKDAKTLTFLANHFSEYTAVPKITDVSVPTDNSYVGSQDLTVKGIVNDPAATVMIKLNGAYVSAVTVGSDGAFSKAVTLKAGKNTLEVEASNSIGSAASVSRTVYYQLKPSLTISTPTDQTTTSDKSVTIKGTVTEMPTTITIKVGSKDAVAATVNSDGTFSQAVDIELGKNAIVITATNAAGSVSIDRMVIRQTLPATGSSPLWALLSLAMLVTGLGLYRQYRRG